MTIADRSSVTFDAPDIAATPGVLDVADGAGRLLGNGDALDLLGAAEESLAAALGHAAFEEMARAARRFDFEAALIVLRRAAQERDQACAAAPPDRVNSASSS